ncbi:MAG: EscU/YscU/HrcU family type III secretion system export apparatus switch protein [Gammaproteobacteria bacterium]|nr:EscU/YscU/HrcU family type III secretion system export apparatus switch protein [Gammaproteobacteria bacterium]
MAEQQQEQNRTERATPFKLEEARKRGQVAKSLEANSFVLLLAILGLSYFAGDYYASGLLAMCSALFANAHLFIAEAPIMLQWFEQTFDFVVNLFWSFVAMVVITAILSNMLQTGPVFSFFPLKPDPQRLSPVAGFKRLFSMRLIYESIKTFIKMSVFGFVIYLVISAALPKLLALVDTDPHSYLLFLLRHGQELLYKLLLVMLLIVLIDLVYTRWDYAKRMRMSYRDIKEELKRREGDPQIRARLRELRRDAAKRAGAVRKVPDADVLITNPARLAIALKYDREAMQAPQLIAKCSGDMAARMRTVAKQHGVPIVENKILARALFRRVDIDGIVPEDLYPTVARILAWIYLLRQPGAPRPV